MPLHGTAVDDCAAHINSSCYYFLLSYLLFLGRIITLEDVLEALLQEQIYDEMDAAGRGMRASSEEPAPLPAVQEQSTYDEKMSRTGSAERPMRQVASSLEYDSYRLM
jgi:hypothetical protein